MLKYRLLIALVWIVVPFACLQRILTGKDTFQTFMARLGMGSQGSTNPKTLWLHAASLGEFHTLELLLPALSAKFQKYDLLITVSNTIAFEKAKKLRTNTLHVEIAPLDFGSVVNRFLNRWHPSCLITIENEVYPNRNIKCAKLGIPILYVNARMSEKSAKTWGANPSFADEVFGCIDYCFPQDQNSYDRFTKLGVAKEKAKLLGNLKQFQQATPVDHPDLHKLNAIFPRANTLCAASTHKGEDQILLDAFALAKDVRPDLKLILVPRHAKRSSEITALIGKTSFTCAVRSEGELPYDSDDIYLADTMGEMNIWYSAAAVTFVAGSLVPVGGHTPFEPAGFGSAIIHGSQYSNFQAIYEQLVAEKGSLQADTAEDIAAAWLRLLDTDHRNAQVIASKKALFENSDKDKILTTITNKIAELL